MQAPGHEVDTAPVSVGWAGMSNVRDTEKESNTERERERERERKKTERTIDQNHGASIARAGVGG